MDCVSWQEPGICHRSDAGIGSRHWGQHSNFSVVNAVLLRPLPFEDPARIVHVWHVPPPKSFPGITRFSVSTANYIDWRQQNDVFEDMAIYTGSSMNLTGGDKAESLMAATVAPNFFSVLGV